MYDKLKAKIKIARDTKQVLHKAERLIHNKNTLAFCPISGMEYQISFPALPDFAVKNISLQIQSPFSYKKNIKAFVESSPSDLSRLPKYFLAGITQALFFYSGLISEAKTSAAENRILFETCSTHWLVKAIRFIGNRTKEELLTFPHLAMPHKDVMFSAHVITQNQQGESYTKSMTIVMSDFASVFASYIKSLNSLFYGDVEESETKITRFSPTTGKIIPKYSMTADKKKQLQDAVKKVIDLSETPARLAGILKAIPKNNYAIEMDDSLREKIITKLNSMGQTDCSKLAHLLEEIQSNMTISDKINNTEANYLRRASDTFPSASKKPTLEEIFKRKLEEARQSKGEK